MEEDEENLLLASKMVLKSCKVCYRTMKIIRKNVPKSISSWGGGFSSEGISSRSGHTVALENSSCSDSSSSLENVRDSLKAGLGKMLYKELKHSPDTVLDKIYYCQRALTTLPPYLNPVLDFSKKGIDASPRASAPRAMLSHDFLVLEILYTKAGDSSPKKLYIIAEKVLGDSKAASIVIDVCEDFEKRANSVVLFSMKCGCKSLGLKEVRCILSKHTVEYDYISENCWDYARKTSKRLLQACQELPGISDTEIRRLKQEEKYMEGRILGYHVHNVVKALKHTILE